MTRTRRSIGARVVALAGLLAIALVIAPSAQGPARGTAASPRPWIEQKAPSAFDAGAPAPRASARYRIDATVLLPLLSIPFASRDDVGFATVLLRDLPRTSSTEIRSYEFFGASFPERARGLNRMGFFREAVGRGRGGAVWTAHFGALSSSPETSRSEVELDGDESVRPYTVLDGFTDRRGSSNRDVRIHLDGSWLSSRMFYERLLPVWRETDPEAESSLPPTQYTDPLGFLSIVEHALATVARDHAGGRRVGRARHPFVHKAEPMVLERRAHQIDRGRARHYAELGLVEPSATVHRIDFRILDRDDDRVQAFRLWTELPPADDGQADDLPMPLGFEFNAKSFLKLKAERVDRVASR